MIIVGSNLNVCDNSGAFSVKCIKILGSKKTAEIGDILVVTVRKLKKFKQSKFLDLKEQKTKVKKGQIVKAVLVRRKKQSIKKDGSYISFDDNAVVLINSKGEPRAKKIIGPISSLVRKEFVKIISLAPRVI